MKMDNHGEKEVIKIQPWAKNGEKHFVTCPDM
jgi:hypothetical protein